MESKFFTVFVKSQPLLCIQSQIYPLHTHALFFKYRFNIHFICAWVFQIISSPFFFYKKLYTFYDL